MAELTSNLNGHTLTPLIDFDFIVNTDLGLIRYIRDNYQDDRAFKLDTLNKSDREILSLLYSRNNINPLSIISTEENLSDIDSLYQSFFDNYKKEIIERSASDPMITNFIMYTLKSGPNFGISPYISIKDDIEQISVSNHYANIHNISFINRSDISSILTKDIYYIKDYSIFTSLKLENKVRNKKIYMLKNSYNIDYFEHVSNSLTSSNALMLMGSDYKLEGDDNNE